MKKLISAATVLAVLAIGGIAYAVNLEPNNQYVVTGGINPVKGGDGSPKNGKPVSVNFRFTVSEDTPGNNPALVQQFKILFGGIRVNTGIIPGCTANKINTDPSARGGACKKALVGTGALTARISGSMDSVDDDGDGEVDEQGEIPSTGGRDCSSTIEIYNSRKNKAAIYITGQAAPGSTLPFCPAPGAIDASFVKSSAGTSLNFVVPDELLHPNGPNANAAVNFTQSTIRRIVRTVAGKRRGFFESTGGCSKAGRRNITVTFDPEQGQTRQAQARIRCTR